MTNSLEQQTLVEFEPSIKQMRDEVLRGLSKSQKELPCKFFYDARGSRLFERICQLDEYYLTRTELAIMEENVSEMVRCIGPGCMVIEYGSGNSVKSRLLLGELQVPAAYVPEVPTKGRQMEQSDVELDRLSNSSLVSITARAEKSRESAVHQARTVRS